MTELQKLYLQARAGNQRGHHAALRHISGLTGIDPGSVDRALKRARRSDIIDEERAKRVAT